MGYRRAWDRWEDDELRRRYAAEPAGSIARELGRTTRSVVARAVSLGVRKWPRFGDDLDDLIRLRNAAGVSDCAIAAEAGCTQKAIWKRRAKLGLATVRPIRRAA